MLMQKERTYFNSAIVLLYASGKSLLRYGGEDEEEKTGKKIYDR